MDDDRARVPFAVVGVVLLLASASLAVTTVPERPPAEPSVDVTVDRVTAETRTAARHAVLLAGDAAAREPVLARANTSAGAVLDATHPFRDSLRVRIYLRVRDRLAAATATQGDVTASASLPPTPNASALARAVERVEIERVGAGGAAVRVTVENVTVTARRGNRTVARERLDPTVAVESPVLELHEEVSRYETRLNRDVTNPGLARGVTARLLQVAWARGYVQYGGGLVENVVKNQHVELATNGAILAEQRRAFGRSDAAGRRALRRATARVAVTDLLDPASRWPGRWTDLLLRGGPAGNDATTAIPRPGGKPAVPEPDDRMRVGVDGTADRALGSVLAGGNVSSVLESAYTASVRRRHEREVVGGRWPGRPGRPDADGDWSETDAYTTTGAVESAREVGGDDVDPAATAPDGRWHTLDTLAYELDVAVSRVREFEDGNRTATTRTRSTVEYRVVLWIEGDHETPSNAPNRPIRTAHDRGAGRFDGPNLADVREAALTRLVADRGGGAALAERAVRGRLDETSVTVTGARPAGLRQAVVANLTAFGERVGNVSTAVRRDRLGTMAANPAGALLAELADRRDALVGAPDAYESTAEKATVAARSAYLDRVVERLRDQRRRHRDAGTELDDALAAAGAGSVALLRDAMGNRNRRRAATATGRTDGGVRVTSVDGSPPYLTLGRVGHERVPAVPAGTTIHPLAAKNVNAFALPHADVADGLFGALSGSSETVGLGSAAGTLRAARASAVNDTVGRWRRTLERRIETNAGDVRDDLRRTLADEHVGDGRRERARTIAAGLARWEGTAATALALSNGSAVASIARAAADRHGLNDTRAAVVRARLSSALGRSLDDHRVERAVAHPVAAATRRRLRSETERAIEETLRGRGTDVLDRLDGRLKREIGDDVARRLGGRTTNRVPSGLPLLPVGTWYTTVNVWFVEVHGAYPRFAVGTRRSVPAGPGSTLVYVREASSVRIDFDEDGVAERFGRNERVSFDVRTALAVAVPPGPPGVGDAGGNVDERSAGWSEWARGRNDSAPAGWPPGAG